MSDDRAEAILEKFIEGSGDYILMKQMMDHGSAGEWTKDSMEGLRFVIWGTLAYLVNLSQRGDFEDDFNAVLYRLSQQIEGAPQ